MKNAYWSFRIEFCIVAFTLFLIFGILCAAPISVPPLYPYPTELPQHGSTPAAIIKVTSTFGPVDYGDKRPVVWDSFTGGGFRCVSSLREMWNINPGYRKEGMLVWVKEDNHIWQLMDNLVEWNDLGEFGPKTTSQPTDWFSATMKTVGLIVVIAGVCAWSIRPMILHGRIKSLEKEIEILKGQSL